MGRDGPWLNLSGSACAAGGPFPAGTAALLAALMGLLVLATVLGNALVILAFVVDRSLRTQGNFFFLNLAVADLLVGGFCIPLYIPYVLTGEWRLGRGLCKLWLVVDYLVCTASVFNIVLISFDRFICVTRAVSYRAQQGMTRNAVLKMLSVWIAAFLLYGPAILSWEHIAQKSILPEGECHAEFFYNWKRTLLRNENLSLGQEDCEMNFQGEKREHTVFFVKLANRDKHEQRASSLLPPGKAPRPQASAELGNQPCNLSASLELPPLQVDVQTRPPRSGFCQATESLCQPSSKADVANVMANRFRLSRDKRVAKSLAVIVCVFGVCWAPYTLLMIIRAACHGHCVHHSLYEISFWLLWVNSAINPVLYPLCHTSFRKAFIKLLCPRKAKIHPDILM
ncbi:histamine H3 receptor-like isoform X2 [Agelaius tricolor]|uniref:histamine H3 receptor-like isoform X2 n=1 Tax=Agelaius tricolor TaxID=9191 RepID=UPI0039F21FA7